MFRSTDGGASWSPLTSGLQANITAATLDADGRYELFTQAGHRLVSSKEGSALQLLAQHNPSPVAGATRSAKGALVLVGSRGARALAQE
ncbi:hypothetical protein D3C84_1107050 [compost metagenome]